MGGSLSSKEASKLVLFLMAAATLLLAIILGVIFIFQTGARNNLLNVYQTWVVCIVYCTIPLLATIITADKLNDKKHRETLSAFIGLCFYLLLFWLCFFVYKNIPIKYIFFISAFYLFITIGGAVIVFLKDEFLNNYSTNQQLNINPFCMYEIHLFFEKQQKVYLSVPIGFFIGVVTGIFLHLLPIQVLLLSVKLSILIAIGLMCWVMYYAFTKTAESFIQNSNFSGDIYIPFIYANTYSSEVLNQPLRPFSNTDLLDFNLKKTSEDFILNVSIVLSHIRKIYFYYNLLNGLILSALIYMIFSIFDFHLSTIATVLLFSVVTFATSQLPYAMGQYNSQNQLLKFREGVTKEDLKEKMEKYTPMFPRFPMLISLSSGFAGGIVFQFFSNIIEKVIK